MKKKLIAAVLTAAAVFSGCGNGKNINNETANGEETKAEETIFAMDTVMTITAYGEGAQTAVDSAAEEISRLDRLLSATDPGSEIYKLNSEKIAVVSEETYELIKETLSYSEKTDYILNPAVYPIVKAWGFTTGNYRIPEKAELDSLKEHINPEKISLDDEAMRVSLNDPALEIDLGSVAKGYAAAKIYEIFTDMEIKSGILSLGGNIQAVGKKTDGSSWRVAVTDPKDETSYAGIIETEDKAVVTSGNYQRFFEENGKVYHHIIDPATCSPAESGLSSVTIVSQNGTAADAYSTALFIMGEEKGAEFWRQNKTEFDAVFITDEGKIYITEGLKDSFTPTDKNAETEIIY